MRSSTTDHQLTDIINEIKELIQEQQRIQERQHQLIAVLEQVVNKAVTEQHKHTPAETQESSVQIQRVGQNGDSGATSPNTKEKNTQIGASSCAPIITASETTIRHEYHTPTKTKRGQFKQEDVSTLNQLHTKQEHKETTKQFHIGEHIYIKNKVTHGGLTSTPRDRTAIITHIDRHQVNFRTYTGVETWRSPYNIRHLTYREQQELQQAPSDHSRHES